MESVAFQIGSAIKRITLTEQEKEAARISERNRLARDLHDSVNQMLFSVKVTAHAGQGLTDIAKAQQAFKVIEETSQNAVSEMRALIWQLKPVGLEHGLVHALKQYSEMLELTLHPEVHGLIDLSSTVEEHLYRIVQEAMNNTKKHTDTHEIQLTITQTQENVHVSVRDFGRGFDVTDNTREISHGLNNMWQRAKLLQGDLSIDSSNEGTTIEVVVPLNRA